MIAIPIFYPVSNSFFDSTGNGLFLVVAIGLKGVSDGYLSGC